PGIKLQEFGCHVELNLRDAKRVQVFARGNAGHHGRCAYLSCRGCGLCDRGHRRQVLSSNRFVYEILFSLGPGSKSLEMNSVYPFAANFLAFTAYRSRQAGEQKRSEERRV